MVDASKLIAQISAQVAVSAGSACHSGECKISPVLQAMNVPLEWARGTIRFSTGRLTSEAEIDRVVHILFGVHVNVWEKDREGL